LALSSENSHAQIARDLGLKETSLYAWIIQYSGEVLGTNHDMTAEQELAALKKKWRAC
jgi:transposase-like protein